MNAQHSGSANFLQRWLPGVDRLRLYERAWLRGDIAAGLILTAFLVPQGMAYAELAGLPPVNGLYASLIPLLIYAVLGPSRVLILAPDSAIAPMIATAIIPLSGEDMEQRVANAGLLAILVGSICVVGGILRVGFLTDLISRPVRVGYLAGIALTVIVSQVPTLLGIEVSEDRLLATVRAVFSNLDGIDAQTTAIGFGALLTLVIVNRKWPAVPAPLLVVVAFLLLNRLLGLDVEEVGSIPSGLPRFGIPNPESPDAAGLIAPAFAIALIAFADTSVLSRSYARRFEDEVDSDQELRALGGANVMAGLFQGFPISSSSSRTPVAEQAGGRSPLVGVVGAVALGAVLLFATNIFRDLPTAALAAVLVAAALKLIDMAEFHRLWVIYRPDCYLAIAAAAGVSLFGVLWGVGVASALSIAAFLWRSWHPHIAVLGRSPGVKGYHDRTRYPDAEEIPGLLIFRFDAPIYFANAEIFRQSVLQAVGSANRPLAMVVIAAEPITDLDSTAADSLTSLDLELDEMNITLAFAELRDPMRDRLRAFGLVEQIGQNRFYQTLGQAVRSHVEETGVPWIDWEDEPLSL